MKMILTIDTEGVRGNAPVLTQIWGKVGREYYGIPKIIEICNKYQVKGLFFVDFAEIYDYGYDNILEVVRYIKEKGHDIGVHVHPHHYPLSKKHFLWEYTYDEQFQIISDCTKVYKKMIGAAPLSFRAGKYGANNDTIKILSELGYKYDFSEYYSQKWCEISPPIAYVLPQQYMKLTEFPVTVFKSLSLGKIYHRYDKLEITGNSTENLHIIEQYSGFKDEVVITLFAHSFSFLDYLKTPDAPKLNRRRMQNFEKVIAYIRKKEMEFISEAELKCIPVPSVDSIDNIVCTKGKIRQIVFSAFRLFKIKNNKKANLLIGSLSIVFVLLIIILWGLL